MLSSIFSLMNIALTDSADAAHDRRRDPLR